MNLEKKEDILIQIKDKLRKDDIKLWLEPYYLPTTTSPSVPDLKRLAEDYSTLLKIPYDDVYPVILELQSNSIENLKQRNRFKESGLATLKIKILHQNSPPRVITKELLLSMRGRDLKELITKEITASCDRFKIISSGKVLNETDSLATQGVRHGQQVLALLLSETPLAEKEAVAHFKELENVKTDSRLLALDNQYMELEDQFGNPIKMPANEKKALIVAMALHEKGKSALNRNDYTRALVFLLEADEEYKHCNCQILNSVDNYALLDLDIAWCYLCLESVANLPEASQRLKRCEGSLNKTYGTNFERLMAVKGTAGSEAVLFVRLHLLQAIILYHQNKRPEALELFRKTKQELQLLKVDENSVMQLVELGYNITEARLGLRAANGNINFAANYIDENRQKRQEARRKAIAEEILEREKKKLGMCDDGKQYVDPNFLKLLVNMGFNKEAARIALQKTNNVISDSVQYIQENPVAGPSATRSEEMVAFIDDLVPQLIDAGFDSFMAKLALHKHMGDIMKAAEDLLANNGQVTCDPSVLTAIKASEEKKAQQAPKKVDNKPSEEQQKQKDEAFQRLAEDITMVDDNHLDFTLEQEETFLSRYMTLLGQ